MTRLFYVVGYPGVGKTTAVSEMLANLGVEPVDSDEPVPHTRYNGVYHLGRQRLPFGGTDTLALNIQPKVTQWLLGERRQIIVVGEGDRLANAKFFDAMRAGGVQLHIALLDLPPREARQRAVARAADFGLEPQSMTWFQGRVTKVDNLAGRYRCTYVDARQSPEAIGKELWAAVSNPDGPVSARVGAVERPPAI